MFTHLTNRKVRDFILQAAFLSALVGLLAGAFVVGKANLEAQGLTSGFGFLDRATGFDVGFSLIPFTPFDSYGRLLVVGLLNTIALGAISLVLASIVGLFVAIFRTSQNPVLNKIGTIYVEIFRNIPIILQVFFWYAVMTRLPPPRQAFDLGGVAFASSRGIIIPGLNVSADAVGFSIACLAAGLCAAFWLPARLLAQWEPRQISMARWLMIAGSIGLSVLMLLAGQLPDVPLFSVPELKGLNFRGGIRISPELSAMIVAISIYGGAYIAEIIRAGFLSVGQGQVEAAQSLGMKPYQILRLIRLPLALRAVFPTLINQYVWLFKATTLGIAIGFSDFFFVIAVSINQVGQTIELLAILMVAFFVLNNSMAWVLNRVNASIALKGSQGRG